MLCIKDDQIVGDNLCMNSNNVDSSDKPTTMEKCKPEDVSYCKPKWHYSEWTEVTKDIHFHLKSKQYQFPSYYIFPHSVQEPVDLERKEDL